MRTVLTIGLKDLRLRLRDRSAIILAFVAPLLIASIISFAFGQEPITFRGSMAIADLDSSDISRSFIEGVRSAPALRDALEIKTVASEEEARALVEKEEIGAAIVLPKGLSDAIQSGQSTELSVIRSQEFRINGALAEAIAEGFSAEVNAGRLSIQTAAAAGAITRSDSPGLQALIQEAVSEKIPVNLVDGAIAAKEVKAASYFGPSMSIFFLLFTVQFGALGIRAERRDGTLARLLASPTRPWAIVTGKVFSSFVLGLASLLTMYLATTLLLGADWGDPLSVFALSIAMVFAAVAVTGLVIASARTYEQAQGFGQIATMVLAMLGGNFIQVTDAPEIFRRLSLFTPNGWAIRAFFDLSAEGGGITTILGPLAAIVAFAVGTGAVAIAMGRRLVTQ